MSTNDPWATKYSHRHLGYHHATPCLKLMSTRIFKANLSEGGRFPRRGLFKIHFSVGGGKLISTQLYVSHASQLLWLPWKLRVFDSQKKESLAFHWLISQNTVDLKGVCWVSWAFQKKISRSHSKGYIWNYLNCNWYQMLKATALYVYVSVEFESTY